MRSEPLQFRPDPAQAKELLAQAARGREDVARVTTAYRLVDDAADGCPGVTVDRYGDYAVIALRDDAATAWLAPLAGALTALFARGVYVKRHTRSDLRHQGRQDVAPELPVAGTASPEEVVVEEYGMRLTVALHDGLSTGLFTDQRENRRLVRQLASGTRMLNLFSYTCSFTLAAALGNAAETVSVDLSRRALERGRRNLASNDVAPESHRFFREDAVSYVERAVRRGEHFGVIVLDPPSFGTRAKGTFSVERDYPALARNAVSLLSPGGRLLAVTNHRKTPLERLHAVLRDAARDTGRCPTELRALSAPLDHPHRPGGEPVAKSILLTL